MSAGLRRAVKVPDSDFCKWQKKKKKKCDVLQSSLHELLEIAVLHNFHVSHRKPGVLG